MRASGQTWLAVLLLLGALFARQFLPTEAAELRRVIDESFGEEDAP